MLPLTTLEFIYQERAYGMLLSQVKGEGVQVRVTVMNGELEKVLHGHSLFNYTEGCVAAVCQATQNEAAELQAILAQVLEKYCRENLFEKNDSIN